MPAPIYSRRRPSGRPLHLGISSRMASNLTDESDTVIFISNLHCSSCAKTIEDTLASLAPPPSSVHVSIVEQSVTVRHPTGLASLAIKQAIDNAGFDIVATPSTTEPGFSFSRSLSSIQGFPLWKTQKHVEQCVLCKEEHVHGVVQEESRRSTDNPESQGYHRSFDTSNTEFAANVDQGKGSVASQCTRPSIDLPLNTKSASSGGPFLIQLSVGGMTCASCSNTVTDVLSQIDGVSDAVVNLLGNSATFTASSEGLASVVVSAIEDAGYEAEVISTQRVNSGVSPKTPKSPNARDGPHHVTLSVGGMTCASCSNTITDLVSQIPGVTDLVVNVLGKSATATVEHKKLVADIITTIEDAGYEAEAVALQPIDTETDTLAEPGPRTISLRVDGMFCKHCPDKVMTALAQFGSQIEVHKPIETYTDPILQLTYQPAPPSFTIRTIISTVANAKSPPFVVSIHRPATLEEKARNMQIREQRGLLLRLAFAVIAAIPTFIIGIVYMTLVHDGNPTKAFFMEPMWTGNTSRAEWALFFLSTPVMFYSAGLFHRRSLKEIRALWRPGSRTPVWKRFIRFGSMNLLVSAGVSVAYFASIALLALASTQPRSPAGNGDTTTYFDSVVFLTMFLLSGRYLEAYSKSRTADAITALGKLRPTEALLLVDSAFTPREPQYSESGDLEKGDPVAEKLNENGFKTERVDVSLLEMGDVVRVPSGSTPPADGIILRGDSGAFDESSLTGESRLIKKEVGDRVFLGTINKGSMVDVRVDTVGGETMLDHIMKVVREGQTRRAPIERVADILTGYFVPIITLLAISTWIIWLGLGEGGALPSDYLDIEVGGWLVWSLEFAIAVFVVACPCGIGLAAPTALLVGSGLAAKFGILARGGGEAFQEAAQLDVVVFDKTGTLTTGGEPQVTDAEIQSLDDKWKREVILGIAAEIESASSHPLASAIRRYCEANGAVPTSGSAFEETAGKGLKATFESSRCAAIIGNEAWMRDHGAAVTSEMMDSMEQWKSEAKSVVLMAIQQHDGPTPESTPYRVVAIFAVADEIRPEARDVIDRLQAQGLGTWMISGDNATTAKAVAKLVGIPESNVIAGVLPHEKAEKIQWLQQVGMKRKESKWRGLFGKQRLNERCIVAMVGDGINDAPALTVADVSIAIGSGSDVAVTSASFILVSSNLRSLLTLVDLSRKVFNRVKFNFVWAVMYNLAALPIAAGVVYPAGHARLSPVWASLAMALSSVSVVCSSLLLKLYKEPRIIPA